MDARRRPPSADQRKVHRQQRLQPGFLQVEGKARHQ
jgi:hypothetical protein